MNTRILEQPIPFALISKKGLGLSHVSNQVENIFTSSSINSGQTKLAINSANGNVVVTDKIISIEEAGIVESLGMVWNSNDQKFRLPALPVIKENTSYFSFLFNTSFTITEPDGSTINYVLNSDNKYIADTIGQEGISYITKTQEGFERHFAKNGLKEIYNNQGQLISKIFTPDVTVHYQHTNETDFIITLPCGRKLRCETDINEKNTHHVYLDTLKLVSYQFEDNKNTVITHIPQKNGSIYKTTYKKSQSDLTIISDDTCEARLVFNPQGEAQRITMGEDANSRTWNMTLDKN